MPAVLTEWPTRSTPNDETATRIATATAKSFLPTSFVLSLCVVRFFPPESKGHKLGISAPAQPRVVVLFTLWLRHGRCQKVRAQTFLEQKTYKIANRQQIHHLQIRGCTDRLDLSFDQERKTAHGPPHTDTLSICRHSTPTTRCKTLEIAKVVARRGLESRMQLIEIA